MANFFYLRTISRSFIFLLSVIAIACGKPDVAPGYFVAKNGNDSNPGTLEKPFLTINKAASVAKPGDIITVREGIYRESVNPLQGGTSDSTRIIYQSAQGEDVRILGSEEVKGWTKTDDGLWRVELGNDFFGDFNPFHTLTRHPEWVGVDESGDGWGWLKYGRWTHLGDIIIDYKGLTEQDSLQKLFDQPLTWYVDSDTTKTILFANFGDLDPNVSNTEINVRPYAFFPQKAGLSYITLKGFTVMNLASHWAPPTVFQPAAIGSNGGHHWVIEDNIIAYAKAMAISLGIPNENITGEIQGHHIVRNNVITRCGQGGINGQSWNSDSEIYGNHIENINYRRQLGGWETAAIKHHNANNLMVRNNYIDGVYTIDPQQGAAHGIWNDYRNSNWSVANNIILNTDAFGILVEANWEGPNLFANNVLVKSGIGTYSTRGDAWINNLFIESKHGWENQPWGERVQIGNSRWMQNVFLGNGIDTAIVEDGSKYVGNVFGDGAIVVPEDETAVVLSSPTNFELIKKNEGIGLRLDLGKLFFEKNMSLVTNDAIGLEFGFDATINKDMKGNSREERTNAGPIIGLVQGKNEIIIHKYSDKYLKAKALFGWD
ncbi:MAG: DUF1565 domain-containing protein [bacterium]|nr:DUF1565 domain-containing protein [bacterium]